jgi:hypothetical protein
LAGEDFSMPGGPTNVRTRSRLANKPPDEGVGPHGGQARPEHLTGLGFASGFALRNFHNARHNYNQINSLFDFHPIALWFSRSAGGEI